MPTLNATIGIASRVRSHHCREREGKVGKSLGTIGWKVDVASTDLCRSIAMFSLIIVAMSKRGLIHSYGEEGMHSACNCYYSLCT